MPENAKIKQIQIDSTTYDIEPAAQTEGTAVTVVTGISGGGVNKTTKYLHKTTTTVAPNAHTHSVTVTGTSGTPGGTTPSTSVATGTHTHGVTLTANSSSADGRITYIESHTGASLGTPTSATAAPNAHTHSVTVSGTTGANSGDAVTVINSIAGNSTSATGDVPYISAHTNASLGNPSTATAAPNAHAHSFTATGTVSLGSNSTSTNGVVYVESINSTGASGTPTNSYLHPTTNTVAPNAHTHSITISGNTGNNSGTAVAAVTKIEGKSTSATGDVTFISSHTAASLGTPSSATAAPNAHTHSVTVSGTTGANSGDAIKAITGYPNFSGGSGTTKYLHLTTNTAAPNAHTHSVTISGTTGANSGTAVKAFTKLEGNATSATGDVPYISAHTNASLGTPTSATAAPNAHTHSVTVSGTTGKNSGSGASVLNSIAGNSTSATGDVPYISAHTNASLGTPSSATAAPNAHTHSVTVSGTTGKNSGSGVGVLTGLAGNSSSATGDIPYIASHTAASLGTATSASAAPNGHSHSVTATGTVSLGANSTSTNGIAYISSFSAGTTPKSAATPNNESKSTGNNSGTNFNAITGYPSFSGGDASGAYLHFSAGTTPKSAATPNHSITDTGTNSASETVNTSSHTHAVSLTANTTTATGRITYVESISGSAPSLTGTTTFVTNRGTFTAGSGSFSATRTTAGSGTSARRTLTFSHSHTASSLGTQSTASVGIQNGSYSATTRYLSAATSASSSTVAVAKNTHTHVYEKTTSVSLTAGTAPTLTTNSTSTDGVYYLSSHTKASLGTPTSSSAAPGAHTHSYDKTTSVSLTNGTAPSATVQYFHPSFTGTKATTDANDGTGITAITGYPSFSGGSGTIKYLHVSSGTAAPNEHTHSYGSATALTTSGNDGTGITAITGYPNFSGGSATTKYLHAGATTVAPNEHTHSYGSSTVLTTSANDGTGITAITGYPSFSGGGSTTKYLHPTTTDAAPNSHTHSYGNSAAIATSTNNGTGIEAVTAIAGNSTSATGDVPYIASHTAASLGTATSANAAPHTHTHSYGSSTVLTTGANNGTGITAITGYPSFSGGSGTISYLHTTTANAAPHTHTHSYGQSAAIATGTNSGTGVDAITTLAGNSTSATGDIKYISSYAVSGGTATANVKYFHPSFSGTKATTGANDGTGIDAVTGYPSFSGGGSTTKYLHAGTTSAAPNEHTHSYGSSAVLTTGANSGSGITAITGYPNFSGGSGTPKYLSASTGAPSATINVASTTHTHSYGSSAVLTTGANSGSGVDAITGLAANTTSATGDITYLENVTHTNAAVSSTVNVIKAE